MPPLEERKTTEFLAELRDSGVWGTYEIKNPHLEKMKVGKYLAQPSIHNEERGQLHFYSSEKQEFPIDQLSAKGSN